VQWRRVVTAAGRLIVKPLDTDVSQYTCAAELFIVRAFM